MVQIGSNLIEAANRAEATALLIRCGFRVYRPEADVEGEDLVLKRPDGSLIAVQLKGRAMVHTNNFAARALWMLFPSGPSASAVNRDWFLIPHDELLGYVLARHGHAPGWNGAWSYPYLPQHLVSFLAPWKIAPPAEA